MELLTAREVAKILRISVDSVYDMLDRGDLAGLRIGRSRRITQGSLDGFLRRALAPAPVRKPQAQPSPRRAGPLPFRSDPKLKETLVQLGTVLA